jgi:hypothetical protein
MNSNNPPLTFHIDEYRQEWLAERFALIHQQEHFILEVCPVLF